jgi:hypothetical protein
LPSVSTTPYVQAEEILEAARVMCNDAALSLAGAVLSDSQPYTFTMLEERYEYLQDRLMNGGVNTYYEYFVVNGLTAVAVSDPGVQVQLGYTGYFDGATLSNPPIMPPEMLEPLELWERQTGSTNAWRPMKQASDSISSRAQTSKFGVWDWETDILFLPGASQSNDLKIKGLTYAPELTTPTSPVLISRCKTALASLVAEMAAKSRGGTEAAGVFHAQAEDAIKLIINRTAQKEQRGSYVRRPFRGRRRVGRYGVGI